MDPISNVDRLVLILRQRLSERSGAGRSAPAAQQRRAGQPSAVQALAAVEGVEDRHLKRALIQNLLAENFEPSLVNDARFQQVVDRVTSTIDGDAEAGRLLTRMVGELRAAAR